MIRVPKTLFTMALAAAVLLALGGCDSRTDKTDGGGVILSITEWDGVPVVVSVNSNFLVQIEEIVLTNIPKIPGGTTSQLMNVEVESYEVTFTRAGNGTRIPTPYVAGAGGNVPINGTDTFGNLVLMSQDQLDNPPLSDLLFENGGVDKETGLERITLNVRIRFFGRTLSGDEVQSNTVVWTMDFVA
jgi:hypothetical protein